MTLEFKYNNENSITIEGFTKVTFIIGCVLFILQNFLYYAFIYSLPLDVLGAVLLSISLIYLSVQRKYYILVVTVIILLGWSICTIIWRFLIYQNLELMNNDLYGQFNIVMLFGISAVLFFSCLVLLFRIITYSIQFQNFTEKNEKLARIYLRIYILYILLHISFSLGIVVGALITDLIIMLQLGLFAKLFLVPLFGILMFSLTIYLITIDKSEVNT